MENSLHILYKHIFIINHFQSYIFLASTTALPLAAIPPSGPSTQTSHSSSSPTSLTRLTQTVIFSPTYSGA